MMKKLLIFTTLMLAAIFVQAQWTSQYTGSTSPSRGAQNIKAVDASIVWLVLYDGLNTANPAPAMQEFSKTTNGGTTWTSGIINNATGMSPAMICPVSGTTAFAPMFISAGGGKIMATTDGGSTWAATLPNTTYTTAFAAPDGFPDIAVFFNATDGLIMGDPNPASVTTGRFEIYTTTDAGANWTKVPNTNIAAHVSGEYGYTGVYSSINDTVWFGTNKGAIYRSVDKGLNWTKASTGLTDINEVHFANGSYGIAAQSNQTLGNFDMKFTTDGGLTWSTLTPTSPNPNGTFGSSLCYVPGTARTFVNTGADYSAPNMGAAYSVDGGLTWDYLFTDYMTTQFLDAEFVNASTGWAGSFVNQTGLDSGIYKFSGGSVAAPWNLPANEELINVFPNPTSGVVYVNINNAQASVVSVNVYDLLGNVVFTTKESNTFFNFDLGSLQKGLYMVEVTSGTKVQKSKIMIQ